MVTEHEYSAHPISLTSGFGWRMSRNVEIWCVFLPYPIIHKEFLKIFGAGLHKVTVAIAYKILIAQRQ